MSCNDHGFIVSLGKADSNMEIAEQISPKEMGDLFESNDQFKIPSYQRRYSWEEEHFEDLWRDLQNLQGPEQDHFFGTVVFMSQAVAQGQYMFDIVDGQQRITTVSILLCALRDHLQKNFPDDEIKERIENINESLWLVDRDGERQGMRLTLGNLDQDSYGHLVKGHPDEIDNENIVDAYDYFRNRIAELENLDRIKTLHDKVLDQLIYVSITVEKHSDAYQLFEAMNNRGLSLSPIDLMKNYLLMQSSEHSDTDEQRIEELWGEVIRNIDHLSNVSSPGVTFFRQYFMSSDRYGANEKITRNKLYEPTFTRTIDSTDDIEALLEDIRDKSRLYRKLLEQDVDMFNRAKNTELNRMLRDAKIVSITPFTLFLRAFSETEDVHILKGVIKKSNTLLVRRQICDRNTGPHDTIFNHLAQNAFDSDEPLQYMDDYLESEGRYPSDEQFKRYFQREDFRRSDRTKYILSKMEEDYFSHGGKQVAESRYQVHIEHILPERPGKNLTELWLERFEITEDEHEEFKKKIGNLTLLESDPNIKASNRSLEKKQEYYTEEATDFEMTHELTDKSKWDVAEIKNRSQRLSGIAVDVWSL